MIVMAAMKYTGSYPRLTTMLHWNVTVHWAVMYDMIIVMICQHIVHMLTNYYCCLGFMSKLSSLVSSEVCETSMRTQHCWRLKELTQKQKQTSISENDAVMSTKQRS